MKKLVMLLILSGIISCQNNSQKEKKNQEKPVETLYQIDSVKINWTAYKFTSRAGVNGAFDKVDWKGLKKGKNGIEMLSSAEFKIDVSSLNTGNPGRDSTIVEYLFGKMMETNFIEGRVKNISDKKMTVVIRMNNREKPVDFDYTFSDNKIVAIGQIDLVKDFDASEPLYFLHTACKDKHTGEDGVSKTWPDVKLMATFYVSPSKE